MEKKKPLTKWIYWFLFAVAVITVYKTLDNFTDILNWVGNLFSILMPFIMGVLIAYILYLPCKKIENLFKKSKNKFLHNKARTFSILLVYLIALLLIVLIIKFVIPSVIESVVELLNSLPGYYTSAIKTLNEMPEDAFLNKINAKEMVKQLQEIDLRKYISVESLTQYAKGAISFATGIFDFFVAIIVSIYVLSERTEILKFAQKLCRAIFKEKTYKSIRKYFSRANEVFFKFLSSQLLDAIVVGIITSIAMSILKVKYAVLLGFLIGLFNMIPYFGAIIAVIISVIITIFTGGIYKAITMAIIVTILQQIDSNIINPKITGNSLKISALLVIISVTLGGAYFGVLGMFLAVPIATVLKTIIVDYVDGKLDAFGDGAKKKI